ncbi:MAG: Tol-Pal system beta propeller repeat protein TolB [Perlucidibaca sp.]
MQFLRSFFLLGLALAAGLARAELTIEITQTPEDAQPIAVTEFTGVQAGENLGSIIRSNLNHSGYFRAIGPDTGQAVPAVDGSAEDWLKQAGLVVRGSTSTLPDGRLSFHYTLARLGEGGEVLLDDKLVAGTGRWRDAGHYMSDRIYEKMTGFRGFFTTHLLYVNQYRRDGKLRYRLGISDMDGKRQVVALDSAAPIMAPTWSPDSRRIAYVSFEGGKPAIYMQELYSGQRTRLTDFAGLNSAPAWSPDGRRVAMTLSRDGNPEIYVMDLASRELTRVTNHPAIDTEPRWTSDGGSLIFTSDRSGSPQVYRLNLSTGETRRLTFNGRFNARADLSPDGRYLAMVNESGDGQYRIALQDLSNGVFNRLTTTPLDASPSFAPNSRMLVYATTRAGKGVLAIISLDGRFRLTLPPVDGEIREPVWSSYLR